MSDFADASPTKQFFIRMITRDIKLEDCILDLIDNSLDGAARLIHAGVTKPEDGKKFSGFEINVVVDGKFSITDNCGGIGVDLAKTRAFHFGRPPTVKPEDDFLIGLYGIGMKRALFKIGKQIIIKSSTKTDAFSLPINVAEWEKSAAWNFAMNIEKTWEPAGTTIDIPELQDDVKKHFEDPTFKSDLMRIISRDYAFFLQKKLTVKVNGLGVKPLPYGFRESADFAPSNEIYEDDGVTVQIRAGLAGIPPEDTTAEGQVSNTELYGWFVVCNDRVVVAADKTDRTCWGNDGFASWHSQYNGFMGLVSFSSKDSGKLPWTTTKRDLDVQNAVYCRALVKMKLLTQKFIAYTTRRKQDLEAARRGEAATAFILLSGNNETKEIKLPAITPTVPRQTTTIQYQVPISLKKKVAKSLGDEWMANYRVGEMTFEYYKNHELGDE